MGEIGRYQVSGIRFRAWSASIDQYATGLSRKDVMFDDPLPAIAVAVAGAGDRPTLANVDIDPVTRAVLERAAPVYRKGWWAAHRAANRAWR